MYDVEAANNGFHTKGYIFKKEEVYRIILGSSNMTSAALAVQQLKTNKKITAYVKDSEGKIYKKRMRSK